MFAHCFNYLFASCLFALIFLSISGCSARELTKHEFDTLVHDNKYLFIYFYSENCEDCSKLRFTWNLLEKRIQSFTDSSLVIGQINCDIYKEFCQRERVQKVPAIKLFTALEGNTQLEFVYDLPDTDLTSLESFLRKKLSNSVIKDDQTQEIKAALQEDSGPRVVKKDTKRHWSIKEFYELTDENYSAFLSANGENLIYFYTPFCPICKKLPPKWDLLLKSLEFRLTRLFRINCIQNPHACKYYRVEDYPTLLWISNGHIKQRYKNLANDFIYQVTQLVHTIEYAKDPDELPNNLNTEDFRPFINTGYHFVYFHVPYSKHCERMEVEWLKLTEKRAPINVKLSKVDCSVNEILCETEQIDGYPTLNLYKDGRRLAEYQGARTTNSFLDYLRRSVSKHEEL